MANEREQKGRQVLERLCGDPHRIDDMPERFRNYTIEHLFGDVWQGEGLAFEERSLVTCTLLTALGREREQRFHFEGAKRLGIPREKMVEMITHAAHYVGWPKAVGAVRTLGEVWPEDDA